MAKKRSKIELQGLSERIIDMYNKEQMTLTDITAVLHDEGWDVSRIGVHREVKKWESFLQEQKERDRFAKQFLDEFRDRPNTDISEMTLQIVQSKLLEVVRNYDIDGDSFKDVSKLVNAIGRMSDSQVNLDRLKRPSKKGFKLQSESWKVSSRPCLKKTILICYSKFSTSSSARMLTPMVENAKSAKGEVIDESAVLTIE